MFVTHFFLHWYNVHIVCGKCCLYTQESWSMGPCVGHSYATSSVKGWLQKKCPPVSKLSGLQTQIQCLCLCFCMRICVGARSGSSHPCHTLYGICDLCFGYLVSSLSIFSQVCHVYIVVSYKSKAKQSAVGDAYEILCTLRAKRTILISDTKTPMPSKQNTLSSWLRTLLARPKMFRTRSPDSLFAGSCWRASPVWCGALRHGCSKGLQPHLTNTFMSDASANKNWRKHESRNDTSEEPLKWFVGHKLLHTRNARTQRRLDGNAWTQTLLCGFLSGLAPRCDLMIINLEVVSVNLVSPVWHPSVSVSCRSRPLTQEAFSCIFSLSFSQAVWGSVTLTCYITDTLSHSQLTVFRLIRKHKNGVRAGVPAA